MLKGFVGFVVRATGDVLGLIAVVVITISSIALIALIGVQITSGELSPYLGILTYMVLPAGFIGGLVLLAIARWRVRRALARGSDVPWRLDLNNPAHRERLGVVLALSVINVIILALTAYHGVHYMDSTSFCGEVCHQVMEPEFAAYQNSPHARVSCTDCHIGPGANWFVRSKLSGSRQVLAVAFGTYPQPVPAPIENLRPARETCEQCHWPAKFHGDRMKVLSRFQEDEENTELKTVLVLKVGGGSLESGFAEGIHWHMNLANHVEYRSDEERSTFYWVRVEDMDGEVREYWYDDADIDRDAIAQLPVRTMDCMDCHNRPTHGFDRPSEALDDVLRTGQIADLPWIKREAMKLLMDEYASKEEALERFEPALLAFYDAEYPEIAAANREQIRAAAAALAAIYDRNIFPTMNVTWGTYPNHIGHQEDVGGCFRCHDEAHTSDDGQTISQECTNCHVLLAYEEEEPEVLQTLLGEE
jgi:nitrate/TMAO reductase-like tetraheme cytochrome c subunit